MLNCLSPLEDIMNVNEKKKDQERQQKKYNAFNHYLSSLKVLGENDNNNELYLCISITINLF